MAHKTLIGGTAYEIGGGKTLVGGTAYSIDKGKTLVGGTAYEVGFAKPMATVTVYSYNPGPYDDSTITFPDEIASEGTYELPIGTELVFSIFTGKRHEGIITFNYEQVAYASGDSSAEYTYVLNGNIGVDGYISSSGPSINIYEE